MNDADFAPVFIGENRITTSSESPGTIIDEPPPWFIENSFAFAPERSLDEIFRSEFPLLKILKESPRCKMVILKQGRLGATIFSDDLDEPIHLPSFNIEEKDPTGAGDSFGGAFISSYLQGWDLKKSLQFANAVGALKVSQFGPMPDTTVEDVFELIEQSNQVK